MSISDLYARHRHNVIQFVQFGLVGGVGVLINQVVLVLSNIVGRDLLHVSDQAVFLNLWGSSFNIRNYHVYVMIAFLVANIGNFTINRYWTFRSPNRANYFREYWPFLLVGLAAQAVGMVLLTLLMNPASPVGLPSSIFDGSSGLRTKLYWANLIVIACVTPINFVLNKFWTFRYVRSRHGRESNPEVPPQG